MLKISFNKVFKELLKVDFQALLILYCLITAITTTMATSDLQQVATGNAKFATQFYNILAKEKPGKNIFFSPLSAHTVLALAYQGASGDTATSFSSTLNVPNKDSAANGYSGIISTLNAVENVTLHVANKVFVMDKFPLKTAFQKAAKELFFSEAQHVNFADSGAAANTINQWVENKTNSKIKDLISADALNALTRLVLVNAVYFKGNWADQFKKESTTVEPFYITNDNKVDCQMMHITKKYLYRDAEELDAKIVQLPYDNRDVSMVIILPNARDGITKLEEKLANVDLSTVTDNMYNVEVDLSLPKFKIETSMELNDLLSKMGLGVIFDQNKADFSEISDSDEQLFVSKVIQKAFIEVNEEGAEAAAATAMKIRKRRALPEPPRKVYLVIDHPFIFQIIHKDSNKDYHILFYGKINKPPKQSESVRDEL